MHYATHRARLSSSTFSAGQATNLSVSTSRCRISLKHHSITFSTLMMCYLPVRRDGRKKTTKTRTRTARHRINPSNSHLIFFVSTSSSLSFFSLSLDAFFCLSDFVSHSIYSHIIIGYYIDSAQRIAQIILYNLFTCLHLLLNTHVHRSHFLPLALSPFLLFFIQMKQIAISLPYSY